MKIIFDQVEALIGALKKKSPEIYKACTPRRYVPPNGYANPRFYVPHLSVSLTKECVAKDCEPQTSEVVSLRLLKYNVPTYFICEDFCRACAATKPPEDTLLSEIKYPMEAMLMVLPENFIREYAKAYCPFIAVAHLPIGMHGPEVNGKPWVGGAPRRENNHDRLFIHTPVFYKEWPVDYMHVSKTATPLSKVFTIDEFVTYARLPERYGTLGDSILEKAEEVTLVNKLNGLALKIIMAMAARPNMREEGSCLRPAKIHAHREKEELWSPNFIGRNYRIVHGPGYVPQGSHASPEMHWRRGHMRNQKFGHQLSQSKLIWIDPVLVNAEPKVEENAVSR